MEHVDTTESDAINHQNTLRDLEKAHQRLGQLIKDLKDSQGTPGFLEDLEFNLPVVMNYVGAATQKARLQKPEHLITTLIPTYWRQTLRFPMETHSLEEVWKSMWKCNLSPEELQILKQIELPGEEGDSKKSKKKTNKKYKKKPVKPEKKLKTDLDSDEE